MKRSEAVNRFPVLISISLMLLATGCSDGTEPDSDRVELRLENASDLDFESVVVQFTTDSAQYGAIAAGSLSDFRAFDVAYRYAYIEVATETDTLRMQPIDYVGEEPLTPGRYRYVLDVVDGRLALEFTRE